MRNILFAIAVIFAFTAVAWAGPKDKIQQSLVAVDALAGNAYVDNALTTVKIKQKGCAMQLQMKDLKATTETEDGDIIICIASADVMAQGTFGPPGAGNGVVMLGEVKKGKLKIKGDFSQIGCGGMDAINFNGDVRCYLDDPDFIGTNPATNWQANCLAAGNMIGIPNPIDVPAEDEPRLKLSGLQVIPGICQGYETVPGDGSAYGKRIVPPASPEIARFGAFIQ